MAVIVLFALWTGWSLARTTIIDADKWNDKANRELERIDTIQPIRGDILACDGSILATNVITYDAAIDFKASRFMTKRMRQDMAALCDTMAMFYPRYSAQQWRDKFESQLDRESKNAAPTSCSCETSHTSRANNCANSRSSATAPIRVTTGW